MNEPSALRTKPKVYSPVHMLLRMAGSSASLSHCLALLLRRPII